IFANHGVRQLAFLAHRNEPDTELMRHGAAQNEAARFQAGDAVDFHAAIGLHQRVHGSAEGAGVTQQGGDVAEQDPFLGIVRDGADGGFDVHFRSLLLSCPSLTLRAFVARNGPLDHFVRFANRYLLLNTRPATASSLANKAGSRFSGAVISAMSSMVS